MQIVTKETEEIMSTNKEVRPALARNNSYLRSKDLYSPQQGLPTSCWKVLFKCQFHKVL